MADHSALAGQDSESMKKAPRRVLFSTNIFEKGRRADIKYQPEYYEKNLISSITSDVHLFMVI